MASPMMSLGLLAAPVFPVVQLPLLEGTGLVAARTASCVATAEGAWTLFTPIQGSQFQGFEWKPGRSLGDWSDAYGIAFDVINRGTSPLDGRCYLDKGNPATGGKGIWTNWSVPADGRPYTVFLSLLPWGQMLQPARGEYAGFAPIACDVLRSFQNFGDGSYVDAKVEPDTGRPTFLRQVPSAPSGVLLAIQNRLDGPFSLANVRLVRGLPATGYQRVIDRFGQNAVRGGVRTVADLQKDRSAERTRLATLPPLAPAANVSTTKGGWRTERNALGRWIVRNPAAQATRFLGIVGANVEEASFVDTKPLMAAAFDGLDTVKREFGGACYDAAHGSLDWRRLNLSRKYGDLRTPQGFAAWKAATEARMDAIGFNLVRGNTNGVFFAGSGRDYMRSIPASNPYDGASSGTIRLGNGTVVPDPYAAGFPDWLKATLQKGIEERDLRDPHCVGWTMGNEFNLAERSSGAGYTWAQRLAIPVRIKTLGGDSPSKRGMVALLKRRYKSDIEALKRAWGVGDYTSFDGPEATSLLQSAAPFPAAFTQQPTQDDDQNTGLSAGARVWFRDMSDAQYLFVLKWSQTFARVYRQVAPGKLVLGAQVLTQQPRDVLHAIAESQDVLCLNFYGWPNDPILRDVLNIGRPVLITETGFSVTDQGPGSMFVRAGAMVRSAQGAADRLGEMLDLCERSKNFVGLCWYQMYDQPTLTGRYFDGEANANGLYTIADRPKWPLLMRLRSFAQRMRGQN